MEISNVQLLDTLHRFGHWSSLDVIFALVCLKPFALSMLRPPVNHTQHIAEDFIPPWLVSCQDCLPISYVQSEMGRHVLLFGSERSYFVVYCIIMLFLLQ